MSRLIIPCPLYDILTVGTYHTRYYTFGVLIELNKCEAAQANHGIKKDIGYHEFGLWDLRLCLFRTLNYTNSSVKILYQHSCPIPKLQLSLSQSKRSQFIATDNKEFGSIIVNRYINK